MAGRSRGRLTREEVENLLGRLKRAVVREECWSCECLQGFIAQLEMDAVAETREMLGPHKVDAAQVHGCLGCEPCPPAEVFAEYLMRKRNQ